MPKLIVTGDKRIDKALRALGPKVGNKVVRRAMREGMQPVKAQVEADAPKGETGNLARSVKVRAGKRSRKGPSVEVLIEDATFRGERYYAAFEEYGTSRMPGRYYMTRAYDARKAGARDAALTAIRSGIDREARSL